MDWMNYCSYVVGAPFKRPEIAMVFLSNFGEIWIFGQRAEFLPEELIGIKMTRLQKDGKNIALRSLSGGYTVKDGLKILQEIELLGNCPDFKKRDGLILCIVQDWQSNEVLMHCYMDVSAWEKTRETGYLWRYSTSQKKLQQKGETSGNIMKIHEIVLDCDRDACLIKVEVLGRGEACHTRNKSCFFDKVI